MSWLSYILVIFFSLVWLARSILVGAAASFGRISYHGGNFTVLGWTHSELSVALPILSATVAIILMIASRFVEAKGAKVLLAVIPVVVLGLSFGVHKAIEMRNEETIKAQDKARRELGR